MSYSLVAKAEALEDIRQAYFYYEGRQKGLGERFLKAVEFRFDQITLYPENYSYITADKEKTMRDVKLKGFPFVNIYDVVGSDMIVYGVQNTHKRPLIF